jgi:PqqD family protein of HPr-rel-A system
VRADVTVTELDGEAVIYDERSGDLHHLNGSATLVLGLCDGSTTLEEMSIAIADAFERPLREVSGQVSDVLARLSGAGVIEDVRGEIA